MLLDKKNNKEGIQMVLLEKLGSPLVKHVDKETHIEAFNILQAFFKK